MRDRDWILTILITPGEREGEWILTILITPGERERDCQPQPLPINTQENRTKLKAITCEYDTSILPVHAHETPPCVFKMMGGGGGEKENAAEITETAVSKRLELLAAVESKQRYIPTDTGLKEMNLH